MREILFRGKRKENGEWIYGNLAVTCDCCSISMGAWFNFAVDPATLGQYTGLKDKNGKKIFEGDIVLWCEVKGIVVWEGHKFVIKGNLLWDFSDDDYIEVIGNIHDNPELLGGVNNNGC